MPSVGTVSFSWKQKRLSSLHSGTFCKKQAGGKLHVSLCPWWHQTAPQATVLRSWHTPVFVRLISSACLQNLNRANRSSPIPFSGALGGHLFTDAAPAEAAQQELWELWICHLSLSPLESPPFPSRWTWPEQLNRTLRSFPNTYHPVGNRVQTIQPWGYWVPRQAWEFWALGVCLETD